MENLIPPINQRIKIILDTKFNGNVSAFCAELGYTAPQKVHRLFTPDARNGKYPMPSTEMLIDISNKFDISLDSLVNGSNQITTAVKNNSRNIRDLENEALQLLGEPEPKIKKSRDTSLAEKLREYKELKEKADNLLIQIIEEQSRR